MRGRARPDSAPGHTPSSHWLLNENPCGHNTGKPMHDPLSRRRAPRPTTLLGLPLVVLAAGTPASRLAVLRHFAVA